MAVIDWSSSWKVRGGNSNNEGSDFGELEGDVYGGGWDAPEPEFKPKSRPSLDWGPNSNHSGDPPYSWASDDIHHSKSMLVKRIQKLKGGADLWHTFLEYKGGPNGGRRDPFLRPTCFLDSFLSWVVFIDLEEGSPCSAWGDRILGPTPYQEAVGRVKVIHRAEEGIQAWNAFIERLGGGKRDPATRMLAELTAFLAEADPSGITVDAGRSCAMVGSAAGAAAASGGRHLATSHEHAHAIARVKVIQREVGGMDLWHSFTEKTHTGKRDPAAYDVPSLLDFLREADPDNATIHIEAAWDEDAVLAQKVKQGQRQSEEFKEAWIQYVYNHGNDVRDPARHPPEFLRAFLERAPQIVNPYDGDEEHASLVREIKNGQRQSDNFKQEWYNYCNKKGQTNHDPARHDKEFLSWFILNYSEKPVWQPYQPKRFNPY